MEINEEEEQISDVAEAAAAVDSGYVNIRPKTVYGLRTNVIGNIHFNLEQEVVYPVEGVLAVHDFVNKSQKFMKFADDVTPYIMVLSPTRKLLAVLEEYKKQTLQISLYDLELLKKRRSISVPKVQRPYIAMQFVNDGKAIALLTKPPEELLYLINIEGSNVIYESRPTLNFNRGYVQCLACHPSDTRIVAVGGDSILLYMSKAEKGFIITQNFKIDFYITTMAFTTPDLLWLGTSKNELIIIENNAIAFRGKANSTEVIDLRTELDPLEEQSFDLTFLVTETLQNSRVVCMTTFKSGMAFAIFNRAYVFERVYPFKFERKTVINIPIQLYSENLYQIQNLAVDHKNETILATTKHSQIYIAVLIVPETLKTKFLNFEPLGSLLHIADIVHVSICAWKPIIMTASRDQTVRIWNYKNETTELVRKFQTHVCIAELNPLGLTAAIAFKEQIRIAQIFMDELNIIKSYRFPNCKAIKFSKWGHYMAAAYHSLIVITSVYHLEEMYRFEGHSATVICVCWAQDDRYLFSNDMEGEIRQWDIYTRECVQQIQKPGVIFRSICCTNRNPLSVFAVSSQGAIHEFYEGQEIREIVMPSKKKCSLVDMCLAPSDLIMFVSNELGQIFNIKLPFEENEGEKCINFNFFVTQVNKVIFTYDSLYLVTISKGGTLCIWTLENIDYKVAPIDSDLLRSQEILIPRNLLKEKNKQIAELEYKLRKQVEDFQFKVSQNEISDGQQMAEVHRDYCKALSELKEKNKEIAERHAEELAEIKNRITEIKDKHNDMVKTMTNENSDRLLVEYNKFTLLRDSMIELRENYEEKLKKSTYTLEDTVRNMEHDYKKQLDERKQTIRELMEEMNEFWIFVFLLDNVGTVFEYQPLQTFTRGTYSILCVCCNPADISSVAVGGENTLLYMARNEKSFNITHNFKIDFTVSCLAFSSNDLLWVGTTENQLVLVEGTDIKLMQPANTAEAFDLLWDQDALEKDLKSRIWYLDPEEIMDINVVCMLAHPNGFLYAIFNRVYVFEKIGRYRFERKMLITIPINFYEEPLFQIKNLVIDSKQENIIVSTLHAQLYTASLKIPENTRSKKFSFSPLGLLVHIDGIVHVSVCAWKPIIMTASRDQTIRIWNYDTNTTELVRKFQVDIKIVELNAMGLFAAIGFTDQLRVAEIFMDELNIVKTYNFPRCKNIKYSDLGHFMGVAYDNMIVITSVNNLEIIKHLKGHNGIVLSLCWTKNDQFLISGGADGAIYVWDVETGVRLQEMVQKGTEYRCICCTHGDPFSIYAATNHGVMREFQKSEIVREVAIPSRTKCGLQYMALARSDMIMFVSNEIGELFNVKLPFMEAGGGGVNCFRFFATRVNNMVFSYDGTLLITVSDGGTLAIWALQNIKGKIAPMDRDLLRSQEILIPRSLLKEKIEQISTLELRLKQQADEFQYQLDQNEIFDGQHMAEVHQRYIAALEELKQKNSDMEEQHAVEMNKITFQINDLNKENHNQVKLLSNQFSEQLMTEYHKYSSLRENMLKLRDSYENRLKQSAGQLQDTVEGLETNYKKQLDERKELIRELLQEMGDKKIEFIEFCRQVEQENSRNIAELQFKYEEKLDKERAETKMWRGRAGVTHKKYENLSKNIESMVEEVETLKEEHAKSQKNIKRLNRDIEDLQKDISDHDFVINAKENRIQELQRKNMELDKHKQVMAHKIAELKAQIEPIEFQINDKRKHINQLENELNDLNQQNMLLESQLKELTERYMNNIGDLRMERYRSKTARAYIHNLCSDIYHLAGKIHKPNEMKAIVKAMFQRHANDNELKRFVQIEEDVRAEFERQRANTEETCKLLRQKANNVRGKQKSEEQLQKNIKMLKEIETLRAENKTLSKRINKYYAESLIKTRKKEQKTIEQPNK